MDISSLPITTILALLPGIISTLTIKKLVISGRWDNFKFGVYVIVYSGLVYTLYFNLLSILNIRNLSNVSVDDLVDLITVSDILWSSLGSLIIGLAVSASSHYKLLFRMVNWLKITDKFGDEDLYYNFTRNDENQEVYIKDFDNNLTYHGYITGYAQSKESREIELDQVYVYSYEGNELYYKLKRLSLSLGFDNRFLIEVPELISNDEERKKDTSGIETESTPDA